MGYNFPNSPALNATYTPAGGPTYSWNGVAWQAVVQGVPVTVYVSDTAPPSPAIGQLWWDSDSGTMAIWYADADSAQWVQVSGAVSATPTAQARNRVVNGAMQISQETAKGTGLSVNGSYIADQFALGVSTTGAPLAVVTNAPDPYIQLWASTANAAPAAGHYFQLYQPIEGIRVSDLLWGTVSAKPVVVRFEAQSSIVGTATFSLSNDTSAVTYLKNFTFTQANVWQTFTIAVPGATTGTWKTDNTSSFVAHWCVMAGSGARGGVEGWQAGSFIATSSTSNWMSVAGQTFQIRNIGLYADPPTTGIAPPWVMPDEAEELRACQRYWEKAGVTITAVANVNATSSFLAAKRVQPALSVALTGGSGATFAAPGNDPSFAKFYQATVNSAGSTATVAGNARM